MVSEDNDKHQWRHFLDLSEQLGPDDRIVRTFTFDWDIYFITHKQTFVVELDPSELVYDSRNAQLFDFLPFGAWHPFVYTIILLVEDTIRKLNFDPSIQNLIEKCATQVAEALTTIGFFELQLRYELQRCEEEILRLGPVLSASTLTHPIPHAGSLRILFVSALNETKRTLNKISEMLIHATGQECELGRFDILQKLLTKEYGVESEFVIMLEKHSTMTKRIADARNALEHADAGNRLDVRNFSVSPKGIRQPYCVVRRRGKTAQVYDDVLSFIRDQIDLIMELFEDSIKTVIRLRYPTMVFVLQIEDTEQPGWKMGFKAQ